MRTETMFMGFTDRAEGGHRLAERLQHYREKANTIIVGLPRGGVVTAAVIAEDLELPLDVLIVRKLGAPGQEELAMGAIGPGGVRVLNDDVIESLRIPRERIEAETMRQQAELMRRDRLYRANQPSLDFREKTVIVVDDGLATGSTMSAAIAVLRQHHPARVVLAVPVAPVETLERFRAAVDELVCLETPEPFLAVGCWYLNFTQVDDEDVIRILDQARSRSVTA